MKGYRWGLRRRRLWGVGISNYLGMRQLVAGGGVALIGITLIPMLSGLLG